MSLLKVFTETGVQSIFAMLIVFAVLIALMYIIRVQTALLKGNDKAKKETPQQKVEVPAVQGEIAMAKQNAESDLEVIAAIMAALSAQLDVPVSGLRIKSIKRVNNGMSNWENAAIKSNLRD